MLRRRNARGEPQGQNVAVAGSGNGGGTTVTLGNVNLVGAASGDTLFIAVEKLG